MVLSDLQLTRSREHQYVYVPNVLAKLYLPLWDLIARLIPRVISPNALTIATLGISLSHFGLFVYYDYDISVSAVELSSSVQPIPPWVWLVSGLGILGEMGLDCMDGIHARRTKATSLVGELLDHLVDAWRMTLIHPLCLFSLFGRGKYGLSATRQLCLILGIQLVFLTTFITQQMTKILYYPWMYDLGHYHLSIVFVITWYKGGAWRWQNATTALGSNAHLVEVYTYGILFLVSLPLQLNALLKLLCQPDKRNPNLNWIVKLKPIWLHLVLIILSLCWTKWSPNDVITVDPKATMWGIGAVFCDLGLRLMLTTITGTDCYGPTGALVLPFGLTILSCFLLPTIELSAVRLFAVGVTLYHFTYAVRVLGQLCSFYGVSCGLQYPEKQKKLTLTSSIDNL